MRNLILFLLLSLTAFTNSSAQTPRPGRYYIRLANGRALEAEGNTFKNNGCKIQIWSLYRGLNQLWEVSNAPGGRFYLKNVGANKNLDAHDATVHNNGGKVQLWQPYPANVNQQWIFQPLGGNRYTIRCAASSSNKVLDVTGHVIDRGGSAVQLWDALNGANQVWTLELATDKAIVTDNMVDLRGNQTPLRSQGGRGTCTYFGAVAALEAAYKRAGYGNLDLSEEFAAIMYKVLYIHQTWADIRHSDYRENQFGGTQGGGTLKWFLTGFKIPFETNVPYRPADYVTGNWDTRSQIETNTFNNTLLTPSVLKAQKYFGAKNVVVLTPEQLRNPSEYERILSLGYEISISKNGHNSLLIGFDKSNPADKRLIIKNSYGPINAECNATTCGTEPYSEINNIQGAEYITEVAKPSSFPELAFLGSWKMSVDGQMGTLTVYHIPGIGNLEMDVLERTGRRIQEKRIGIYIDHLGRIFRVNGTIQGNNIEMYIDPVKQNLEWTETIGRRYNFVLNPATDVMTGVLVGPSGVRKAQPNIIR